MSIFKPGMPKHSSGEPCAAAFAGAVTLSLEYAALLAARRDLAHLLDPVWTRRAFLKGGARLTRHSHADIAQEPNVEPAFYGDAQLTDVQLWFNDFAIARLDNWRMPGVSILTMFNSADGWRLVGDSHASAANGRRESHFSPVTAAQPVVDALGAYYRAVDQDDPDALDGVFHPDWLMKNLDGGKIVSEGIERFKARLFGSENKGYDKDRQIADIQLIYDCMAYARVDLPKGPITTVFVLFKLDGRWLIVDKAFSDSRGN